MLPLAAGRRLFLSSLRSAPKPPTALPANSVRHLTSLASQSRLSLKQHSSSTPAIPRMPASKGSRHASGYVEDMSKGKMLRFEESLPKLPVPELAETADKYLKSVKPLLNAQEFAETEKAVSDFIRPGGFGQELQNRLIARRDDPKHANWLSEWWNDTAYLGYRDPVVPYVSYFYSHRDDPKRRDPAKRAAALSLAVLAFKRSVDEKTLEPEYMRKEPIAMSSYKWMFNACRIPAKPFDYSIKADYRENPYFVVVRKNQFWKVPHEVDGKPLNYPELEAQFRRIYKNAQKVEPVGVLTSQNRDVWAEARATLLAAHPNNKHSLDAIEKSSFVVCLDDAAPVTLEERSHQYWHGDGRNRFYDKPLQFIINENGTSGFMGEHSMMDGTPTHRLNDTANAMIFSNALDLHTTSVRSSLPDPVPLPFIVNEQVMKDIDAAEKQFDWQIGQHDLRVQRYQGYGKGLIKKFKCSPDAYVQMIIQLAYYKFYGKNRPTYESAATRKFQEGRTETCRSVSSESVAFCKAISDPSAPREEVVKKLRAAIDAHIKYISEASEGRGVDRHLFGLKKCLKPGEPVPALFSDPAFSYSSTWFISSSQLSSEYYNGYGWSQVVDDGWGIAYMINENSLNFNVVSKRLGCDRMSFYLNEAACDMRDLLLPDLQEKAKL